MDKESPTGATIEILLSGEPMKDSPQAQEFRAILRELPKAVSGEQINIYNYATINIYQKDAALQREQNQQTTDH